MPHDLVIRGGKIVDGTGAEPFIGDLAIDNNEIVAVGEVSESGAKEIDATGHIVTPGFIDGHTHLDAQIAWDPMVTPSTNHGVTTVLLGNCGVTFAPCKPEHREKLAGMMETVEDIPKHAIMSGLSWNWDQYGDYLDYLEESKPAVNVVGLVGHCAIRYYVMGDRAVDELATDEEIEQMAELVDKAVKAGAIGFSTSRVEGHRIPDGRPVPGTFSSEEELCRFAEIVRDNGGGLMQTVLGIEGDLVNNTTRITDLLRKIAEVGGNRLMTNTSVAIGWPARDGSQDGKVLHERFAELAKDGHDVTGGCIPRGSGYIFGFCNELPIRTPAWRELKKKDFDDRVAALDDPEFYDRLIAEAREVLDEKKPEGGALNRSKAIFWLGNGPHPDWAADNSKNLSNLAADAGEHVIETFLRISKESKGKAIFVMRVFNGDTDALTDWMKSEHCLPGLGDAGAHVGQVMDATWATHVLGYWTRDRGVYSLSEGIRRMTSQPAHVIGITDRGTLEVGKRADVNVINYEKVGQYLPEYVHDFPNGAGRYTQPGCGFKATICNGEIVTEDDQLTGARPGRILRGGKAD
ncbi:MAG: amidohydrolase family protein [Pseudomonadota bacterium]|nr:amidohydrolase family protein [Pseudomonadota bacterium]